MSKLKSAWLLLVGGIILLTILLPSMAVASLANVSHAYHADSAIKSGSLVSLDPKKQNFVKLANTTNSAQLTGIAEAAQDSLLAVNPVTGMVQVATSGNANTLVSTLNGNVNVGDRIAVSPFSGIGMKATSGSVTIGLSQTALNDKTPGVSKLQVTDKQGRKETIWVGYVNVTIAITTYNGGSGGGKNITGLQQLAKNITGHTVSTFRVVTSLAIACVTLLGLVLVIYSAIYGSIVSVGRNPLAKNEIYSTLTSVFAMVFLIAVASSISIFFLLR